jgi:hypothetical protein
MPAASPAVSENRAIARRKPSSRHGPHEGASASRKAGVPMVTLELSVNWRGRLRARPSGPP